MKKLILAAVLIAGAAACSGSTTAPVVPAKAAKKASFDLECRSGYVVAYDEQGNPYCAKEE